MTEPTPYGAIAFSPAAAERQRTAGSFTVYGPQAPTDGRMPPPEELDGIALGIIREADSFFLSTVTASGWPYVQHRGGPPGFVHVLDATTLAFADYSGNRQFVTLGNLDTDHRVAALFIDYPTRFRVKVFGRATIIEKSTDPKLVERLLTTPAGTPRTRCDRALRIDVEAFDRNCNKNIPVKYSAERHQRTLDLYRTEIETLRRENDELRQRLADNSEKPSRLHAERYE